MLLKQFENFEKQPDVICLQECDSYHEFWKEELEKMGYNSIYKKKTSTKKDGVAICWKSSLFSLIESKEIELNECTSDDSDLKERLMLRNNVGLFARLQLSDDSEQTIVLATTHIFWDPEQPDVKLIQVLKILQELKTFARDSEPIILAGDFNSLPESQVYIELVKEYSSAFAKYQDNRNEPEFTNVNGVLPDNKTYAFAGTLDYILYSPNIFQVEYLMPLMTKEEAIREISLPNSVQGSDHLPLLCVLNWINHIRDRVDS